MKTRIVLFLNRLCCFMVLLTCTAAYGSDTKKISAEVIAPMLQYNESSIQTFQGKVQQIQYSLINNKGTKLIFVGTEPIARNQTDTEFIHDLNRGKDYWASMRKEGFFRKYIQNQIVRRNGTFVEALGMDKDSKPTLGSINKPKNSYYLGHSPRNFHTQSNIYYEATHAEDGYVEIPLSQLIKDKNRTWIYDDEVDVDGHPCIKIATLHSYGKEGEGGYGLAWVWLGKDVNLNIVKQQVIAILKDTYLNFDERAKESSTESIYGFLDELEVKTPHTLVVNSNYKSLEGNIWVAQEVNSYVFNNLYRHRVEDLNDYDAISKVKDKYIYTQNLKNTALIAYHTFKLDMESLKINEPIDPSIFEKTVIPAGVPVSNYIFGVDPEKMNDLLLDENLFQDTFDKKKPLNSPEIKSNESDVNQNINTREKNTYPPKGDSESAKGNFLPKEKQSKHVWSIFITIVTVCAVLLVSFVILKKLRKK